MAAWPITSSSHTRRARQDLRKPNFSNKVYRAFGSTTPSRKETELAVGAASVRPFLSANDRSRWCTVRALVEPDMQVPALPTRSTK